MRWGVSNRNNNEVREKGWKEVSSEGTERFTYESPDGKWRVTYRTKSSKESIEQIEGAGYKHEVTIEVLINKWTPWIYDKFKMIKEIKFISLRE